MAAWAKKRHAFSPKQTSSDALSDKAKQNQEWNK